MTRRIHLFFTVFIFLLSLLFLLRPVPAIEAGRNALLLCGQIVVPSLFPFLVCSSLLMDSPAANLCTRILSPLMRPLFGLPGCCALGIALGCFSGYPVGAVVAVSLLESGRCTKTEAHRLLAFCNNAGPLFLLGSVGVGMLHNQKLGLFLYLIHILSALLTGILFRNYGKTTPIPPALPPGISSASFSFVSALSRGIQSILTICGSILFFSALVAVLPWQSPYLHALLEVTGGLLALIEHPSTPFLLPTLSFFLALSGASVLLQTAGIVLPAGLSLKPYLLGKIVQSIFAFLLSLFFFQAVPFSQSVFIDTITPPPLPTMWQFFRLALIEILLAITTVLFLCIIAIVCEKLQKNR